MQGFNMGRYVPPEHEGVVSGNRLMGKHALGARASKQRATGELTVRFEMPFAVWCASCPAPTVIGQGVRFNAAKRRVGSYHTTPVWAFRMRHNVCGGEIEVRTDPRNTTYVVVEGGRRRDTGGERHAGDSLVGDGGDFRIETVAERDAAREGAFKKLEKTIADREAAKGAIDRIEGLEDVAERQWEDPYRRNQRLRAAFRIGRKEREREARGSEALKDRMSLSIDLVPATAEDERRAALVDFGDADSESEVPVQKALAKPLFQESRPNASPAGPETRASTVHKLAHGGRKSAKVATGVRLRQALAAEIAGNTRAILDPFLDPAQKQKQNRMTPPRLLGVKRKRGRVEEPDPPPGDLDEAPVQLQSGLVDYDSESA